MSNQPPPPPPPGGYGQQPPPEGYGAPPPPYGEQPPPVYGQPDPVYGQPAGGYGQQPPSYGMPTPAAGSGKTPPMAIVSLVAGILGIPCCGCFVFGIVAAITGYLAKKEIAESQGTKGGASLAQWGFILGLVGIGLGILSTILSLTGVIDTNYNYNFDTN